MHSTIKVSAMRTYLLKLQGALERMINRNQGKAGFKVSVFLKTMMFFKKFLYVCAFGDCTMEQYQVGDTGNLE